MPLSPLCATASADPTAFPAQRPLARRRVMLSRQVIAYYGLIRGSGLLPPISLLGIRRVFALLAASQSVPAFIRVSFLSCRLPYPGGLDGTDCSGTSVHSGLRPGLTGSAYHNCPCRSRFTHGSAFGAPKFALCCGPTGCSPFTDKDFYARAFIPLSRLTGTSSMTTQVNSQFLRPVFHRRDTQPCRLRLEFGGFMDGCHRRGRF